MLPGGLLEMSGNVLMITVDQTALLASYGEGPGYQTRPEETRWSFCTGKNILPEMPMAPPLRNTEHFDENILFLCHLYFVSKL